MRRAAKIDANQTQIVSALEAAGATVQSLASIGKGCPDLLAGFRGSNYLLEVKNPNGKDTTGEQQKKWHIAWNAPVYVVRSADEALKAIGAVA